MNRLDQSPFILTINGGSSSIKFALFRNADPPVPVTRGLIDRIGFPDSVMVVNDVLTHRSKCLTVEAEDHQAAAGCLMEWFSQDVGTESLRAVGHRVVHGGRYREPQLVTTAVMEELQRLSGYDPEHLPAEIELIREFARRYPHLPQVACFDTAFHRDMPRVARLLPIPRRYEKAGLQRYGFHGLSYAF